MTELQIKYYLSSPRFNIYLAKTNNEIDKAYQLYKTNIELSEAFYPILSIFEVCLRNAVNEKLKNHFKDDFWFEKNLPPEFFPFLKEARQKLIAQHKTITADKIIAELNFGFWNRLFNRKNTKLLWKPLRLIFKNIPKQLRKRDTISNVLYHVRSLRNRIYHYEPIFGNLNEIETQYTEMLIFLKWLDHDLPKILVDIDRFNPILEKAKAQFS